jgi:hypothetical protein
MTAATHLGCQICFVTLGNTKLRMKRTTPDPTMIMNKG